jgi:amino acid adenylation domain-containing protein
VFSQQSHFEYIVPKSLPGDWGRGCQAFPASYAQSRLWFLHQLDPNLTAYHLPVLWRLSGDLDLNALGRAFSDVIRRHPTLRTSFRLADGEVLQIIHPPQPFPLTAEPLLKRSADEVMEHWLEHEGKTPFDLTAGLLIRARVLSVDDQLHLLLINHHHIASDGWSLSVLTRDLAALYNAHRNGQPPQLQPLQVLYHGYAAWQRQYLGGQHLQKLKSYWISQLTNLQPLELPTDRPRPPAPSHRGGSVSVQIEPQLVASLETICRSEGATLQMGLATIVCLLMHRYSRQQEIVIGIPHWGRNQAGSRIKAARPLLGVVGFFVNTLPIRSSHNPRKCFRQVLRQIKATCLDAYKHNELPFEQIVEALDLARDRSRNPLVQIILQLFELPADSLDNLIDLQIESLPAKAEVAKFDLSFAFRRTIDRGLQGSITFAVDLFSADRIQRLSSHLHALLSSAVEAPDAPVASLRLLPDAEQQRIASWQQGPIIKVPDLCVHQLFEQQVERTPDAIALVFEDQELSYRDLNTRANHLAHHLIDLGVGPGVIVAVCLERSIELIVSLLGILKAGGPYLPLDPSWPEPRHQLLLREAACNVMINQQGAIVLDVITPHGAALVGSKLAYITYTSGSTGKPKAVAISHHSILRLVDPVNLFLLSAGHRALQLAPITFDAATFEIWGPLLNGGTVVVAPSGQLSLAALAALLQNYSITTLWLSAGLFHAMVESELSALAGVKQVLAGGDVLSGEHVQHLLDAFPPGHELINGYGPTENTTFTCCHHFAAGAAVDPKGVAIGRPIANTEVRVLDEFGNLCPIGIPGELHIGGDGLAFGYLNNPELSAEKFIPDPLGDESSARLYKSGDLASWSADGTLAFHGRIDQQIKLRGFRIEPGEIEASLLAHSGVAQAAVVLRQDDPANPRLIAYWVPQRPHPSAEVSAGNSLSAEQLRAFLAQSLPEFMLPAAFMQLEALPLTSNGKLDRSALPAPSFAGVISQRVAPSTDLERQLHAIWADVLGHTDFGIEDNFWLVGGHSLAAAGLVARIERELGSSMPLEVIFQYPTISEQTSWLLEPSSQAAGHLVTLQPLGSRPPLYVVHGWGGGVGSFTYLASALAPHRPVLGLQGSMDSSQAQEASVRQLADSYADEILSSHQGGPIHLLGYSAGGWYAYAVAEALLQRQAPIGVITILDTYVNTCIHRRLGIALFSRFLVARWLPSLRSVLRPPDGEKRREFLVNLLRVVNARAGQYLGMRLPGPRAIKGYLHGTPLPPMDHYVQILAQGHRPSRLPLAVHLFATENQSPALARLWRFYAKGGVYPRAMFADHFDFIRRKELAPQLAQALEHDLQVVEQSHMDVRPPPI